MGARRALRSGVFRSLAALLPLGVVAAAVILQAQRGGPEEESLSFLVTDPGHEWPRLEAAMLGEGWEEGFPPESFGPQELYLKIDGAADAYLAHGFRWLRVYSFAHRTRGDVVDVYLFDQGDQARALYEKERPPGVEEDPSLGGYFSGASLFMVRGPFYVQIQGAPDTPLVREAVRALGASLSEAPP